MITFQLKNTVKGNTDYRRVLHTGTNSQVVAMSIPVGGEIGEEIHPDTDQIIIIVEGEGKAVINNESKFVEEYDIIYVPAGVQHNFINTDDEELKLFTVYSPPHHPDGTVHKTKEDADAEERR